MRLLVVGEVLPWPEAGGMPIRLANVLRGLARLGAIDLWLFPGTDHWEEPVVPPDVPIRRVEVVPRPPGAFSPGRRLAWWLAGRQPAHFVGRDYRAVQARFARWVDRYDVAWFSTLKPYVPFHHLVEAPAILDYDDLEDRKALERLRLGPLHHRAGWLAGPRRAVARFQAWREAQAWRRLQLAAAQAAAAVVVCS